MVRFKLQIYVVSASDFIVELEPAWSDTVAGIIYDEYLLSLTLNRETKRLTCSTCNPESDATASSFSPSFVRSRYSMAKSGWAKLLFHTS